MILTDKMWFRTPRAYFITILVHLYISQQPSELSDEYLDIMFHCNFFHLDIHQWPFESVGWILNIMNHYIILFILMITNNPLSLLDEYLDIIYNYSFCSSWCPLTALWVCHKNIWTSCSIAILLNLNIHKQPSEIVGWISVHHIPLHFFSSWYSIITLWYCRIFI